MYISVQIEKKMCGSERLSDKDQRQLATN